MKKNENNKRPFFLRKYSKPIPELQVEDDENVREIVVERESGFNTIEVVVIIFVSILFGVVVGCVLGSSRTFGTVVSDDVQEIITTYEGIKKNYYGDLDKDELLDATISGMISVLDDPYSIFMNHSDTENFNETVDGEFVGIGVSVEWVDNQFKIIEVFNDSPAEGKIQVGDLLIKIDENVLSGLTLDKVSSLIAGKSGDTVKITVLRDGKEITMKIKRAVVEMPVVTGEVLDNNIGYIVIDSFASNSSDQFLKELKKLEKKKITSLIIDVRNNPGGRLGQVNEILELFLPKKTVLYQIETKGEKEKVYAKKSDCRDYPIVVLTNLDSASAAEILAASLQDNYKGATLVGTVTYGKGTIQKAYELSSGSSIKYTTQKWLTPKGNWINEKGVVPDVVVDQSEQYLLEPSRENDVQLQKAIEILKEES